MAAAYADCVEQLKVLGPISNVLEADRGERALARVLGRVHEHTCGEGNFGSEDQIAQLVGGATA